MATNKFACIAVVCMVVVSTTLTLTPHVEAAISCGQIVSNLMPCLGYLKSGAGPSPQCCSGVKTVNSGASTAPDRKAACQCLKSASAANGVGATYAASLPSKCGVNIPYKISPSTDCNTVK